MGTDYATVARLLASPARSAVIDALMEGRPLAAANWRSGQQACRHPRSAST